MHAVGLAPVSRSLALVGRLDGAETESKTDGRTDGQIDRTAWPCGLGKTTAVETVALFTLSSLLGYGTFSYRSQRGASHCIIKFPGRNYSKFKSSRIVSYT